MRKLPVGAAISIAVHMVTVTAMLAFVTPPPRLAEAPALTEIEIVTPPAPRRPVAPGPAAPTEPVAPPAVATPHAPRVPGPQRRVEVTTPAAPAAPQEVGPPPPRTSLMMMRRSGDPQATPRVELPRAHWDDLDRAPKGTGPEKDLSTGTLESAGGGTFRSDQGVFSGKVNADGTVTIKDSSNFHIGSMLPTPKQIGKGLADWYTADGKIPNDPDALDSNTKRPNGNDTRPDSGKTVAVAGGGFDVTDWLMRDNKEDPYASKKLAFLDATRDERVQIGNRHRAQELERSTQLMQRNLNALWRATEDPAQRKQTLFELWDECAETGDPQLVAAAQAARKLVIGFIRTHLPKGSAGAYSDDDLAALNRRKQSRAAFSPYE